MRVGYLGNFLFVTVSASQQRTQISMNFAEGRYTRTPAYLHTYQSNSLAGENLTSKKSLKNENFELFDEILHLKKSKNVGKSDDNFQKLTRKETRKEMRKLKREMKKSIKNEIKKYIKDIKKANKWKTWQVLLLIAIIVGIIVFWAFFSHLLAGL